MKKGDLSVNIIIIAAIALIILVIISVLLFGSGRNLRTGTSCSGLQGQCVDGLYGCSDISNPEYGEYYIRHPTAECPAGQVCCVRQ